MSKSDRTSQYDEDFIAALQWIFGDGYLAPGGPAEVAALLEGVNLTGCKVLDVGCGLGAIDVLLASGYGAREVTGIDVEPHLIEHASRRAADAGLSDRVGFRLVEPGPLPFEDASFDVVFSKDAIVHIPDKAAFYAQVHRVLRPGGLIVGSDWLRGADETWSPVVDQWLSAVKLSFEMQDLEQTRAVLEAARFERVSLRDRNAWYREQMVEELATMAGDKLAGLAERIGEDKARQRLQGSRLKQQVIEQGFLRPTHFVGYKPA